MSVKHSVIWVNEEIAEQIDREAFEKGKSRSEYYRHMYDFYKFYTKRHLETPSTQPQEQEYAYPY